YDYETLHQAGLEGVAGALAIAPPLSRLHELQQLNARVPVVVVGAATALWGIDSVACDNETPMSESVQRLAQLGHRRIVGLFADLDALDTQERLQAFCRAASEARLDAWYTLCAYDTFQLEPTLQQQLLNLLRLPRDQRPTAVVAGGFYMAMGALQAAHVLGLRVPEDLSVIGFDDPPAAALTAPPLNTYRQPLQAMGKSAAQHLLRLIQFGRASEPLLQRMPTPYIERCTVAPIIIMR
ncbi:MAG: LacI family DNA-binding transcriptional regulator, partial [Fimbriimonadales bacterium]